MIDSSPSHVQIGTIRGVRVGAGGLADPPGVGLKISEKKKVKWGKERKWEDQTSCKAGRKAERPVDKHKDWQTGRKTSR